MSAREDAYLCLIGQEGYLEDRLRRCATPTPLTYNLARGTVKMRRALDHMGLQLMKEGRLPRKKREIELLRLCLYQHVYVKKIPLFALVDEGVELAKKYISIHFAKFLNGALRRLERQELQLPNGDDANSVAIRLSYPTNFVKEILPLPNGMDILEEMNLPPKIFARKLGSLEMVEVAGDLEDLLKTDEYYIQNKTPVNLVNALAKGVKEPIKTVLDLASSPGGKLLLAADLFPEADLTANDISQEKLRPIEENLERFNKKANLTQFLAQDYPLNQRFDLVIADLPCSNSGVLSRRSEARWRLDEGTKELEELQFSILTRAKELINPGGQLWYLTCSILPQENEEMVDRVCKELNFKSLVSPATIYPQAGFDGGFACSFILNP